MSEADPLAPADPLETMPAPERVNYATGVLLDAEDFRDEQTYHRGRLAAALRSLVGFGTIAGLKVVPPADDDPELELSVEPGIALDRFGRLIEVQGPQCIRLARWFDAQTNALLYGALHPPASDAGPRDVVVDVFLSAQDCARGKTPAFATGPYDALDAVTPARLAELPFLELVPRTEDGAIPAPANGWPAADAAAADKLNAVLGSWDGGTLNTASDGGLDPLVEHVAGHDTSAILLARVTIPADIADAAPAGTRPTLAGTRAVTVDNMLRPFIFLPGKWLGAAPEPQP